MRPPRVTMDEGGRELIHKKINIIPGGTSAGKTFGILPVLIDKAARTEGLEISVVSESIPHLRKGAIKDFLKIMKATGRYVDAHWNRTLLTYTFSNGSYIEFFSVDQEDKVRGPRRHILYVNEANRIDFETYYQLSIRTSLMEYIDFNPTHEFWSHTELGEEDPDIEWLTLTYKDNEGLPDGVKLQIEKVLDKAYHDPKKHKTGVPDTDENIKSKYWANWWVVYGEGQKGNLEGLVFTNWQILDELPKEALRLGYGLDFGFTNDPSAAVALYRHNGRRIFDELFYKKGLTNRMLADALVERGIFPAFDEGWADSAEPKSIREIQEEGFEIRGWQKGPDYIRHSLGILLEEPFWVTKRSVNLIRELERYMYAKNRDTTEFLNKPAEGQEDHAIEAMRGVGAMVLAKQRN